MEPMIFLEVVDRRGNVRERFRVDSFPAGIGRSYRNAVILSDRYVSPDHAGLVRDEQGELWAEDRASTNGMYLQGNPSRTDRIRLQPGTRFRVGRTTLRVCTPGQPVDPVLPEEKPRSRLANWAGTWVGALSIGGASLLALMLNLYLESYTRITPLQLFIQAMAILVACALWAGAWSFVNRVVAHRFDYQAHLALSATAVVVLLLSAVITEYFEFLLAPLSALHWFGVLGAAALLAALLYGHLSIMSVAVPPRRMLAAAAVSLAIFGFIELSSAAEENTSNVLYEQSAQLKPVGAGFLPTVTVDEFLRRNRNLRDEVDSLVSED